MLLRTLKDTLKNTLKEALKEPCKSPCIISLSSIWGQNGEKTPLEAAPRAILRPKIQAQKQCF